VLIQESKRKQKMSSNKSMLVKQCPLCWALFSTKSKHRRFCCTKHTRLWHQYHHLLKKKSRGILRDWEVGLLERLEHFIEKERAVNSEVIKKMASLGVEKEKKGGEGKC